MLELFSVSIGLISLVAAGISAYSAWKSAKTARKQLELVQRKIGMVTDPSKMTEVLPLWYIERMSNDIWGFGLLLKSGDILAIEHIDGVSDDHNWIEVTLLEKDMGPERIGARPGLYAAADDERRAASVRVDQVQAAFEIWAS